MQRIIPVLFLILSACAYAQELAVYDAVLKRRQDDEVVVSSKDQLAQFSRLCQYNVAELRSHRAKGSQDFYLNVYRVTGLKSDLLLPALYPDLTFSQAIEVFKKAKPENVIRTATGAEAVVYTSGFSGDSGTSLDCMLPAKQRSAFVHLAANSIGFLEGRDPKSFDREFRAVALACLIFSEQKLPKPPTPAQRR
jgi:hypothetical protein